MEAKFIYVNPVDESHFRALEELFQVTVKVSKLAPVGNALVSPVDLEEVQLTTITLKPNP